MRELYHRTDAANAANIQAHGFRTALRATTWLTDRPLGERDGAYGDTMLVVSVPADLNLDRWELRDATKSFRQWAVPGALLNRSAWVTRGVLPADGPERSG